MEAERVGEESGDDIEKGMRKITAFLLMMNGTGREKKREYFKMATLNSRIRRIYHHYHHHHGSWYTAALPPE